MRCAKCGAESAEPKKFCAECGAAWVAREEPVAVPGDPGAFYCAKHKKEPTRVTCGRCETPVCTRCAVYGPVGVRCRECAKNRVPLRPRGVAHAVGSEIERNPGRTVWYVAIVAIIVSTITNLFGGGHDT